MTALVSTFFCGVSGADAVRSRCGSVARAANRGWHLTVQDHSCGQVFFGEALVPGQTRRWTIETGGESVTYGSATTIRALGKEVLPSACLGPEVLLFPNAGEVVLWSGNGLPPLFYASDMRGLIVGTDPTLVCAGLERPPELDPSGLRALFLFNHVTPSRTLFEGVPRLPPYHLLSGTGGAWGTPRSFVSRFVASLPRPGTTHVADAVDALLRSVGTATAGEPRIALPLTGGVDSRVLLAALPDRTAVRAYTRGDARHAEVVAAARLAKAAGVAHTHYPFPSDYIERQFPRIVHLTGGCAAAHHGQAIHPLAQVQAMGGMVVPGTNGEFGRGFWSAGQFASARSETAFWERLFAISTRLEPELIRCLRPAWATHVRESSGIAEREFAAEVPVDGATEVGLDWVYLLRRLPLFIAWGPYIWQWRLRVALPFLGREYLEAVAGLSPAHRAGPTVAEALLRRMASRFLWIPLVPSMERLGAGPLERWRAPVRRRLNPIFGVSNASPQEYGAWLVRSADFVESVLLSNRSADRGVMDVDAVRGVWAEHLRRGCFTSVLCKLLTVELACRVVIDRQPVEWDAAADASALQSRPAGASPTVA